MSVVEKKLGQNVYEHRKQAGLTQSELASRINVSTETISRLERGAAIPSLARIEEIATALGVDLPKLFQFQTGAGPKTRAIDRLVSVVCRHRAEDINTIADISSRILQAVETSRQLGTAPEKD